MSPLLLAFVILPRLARADVPLRSEAEPDRWVVSAGAMVGSYEGGGFFVSHRYDVLGFGAGLEHHRQVAAGRTRTLGLRVYGGEEEERRYHVQTFRVANPYYRRDGPRFGWSAGLHVGRIVFAGEDFGFLYVAGYGLLPQLSCRLGRLETLFFEVAMGDHGPGSYPVPAIQWGAGHAPPDGWWALRWGFAGTGYFLEPTFRLGDHLELSIFASYTGQEADSGSASAELKIGLP